MTRVYWFARQFPTKEAAKAAWQKVHDVLETASDLSVSCYCTQRLATRQCVGRPPPESRQQQFIKLCEGGIPVRFTECEVAKLTQMRLQGVKEGRWVVKHHRKPETPLPTTVSMSFPPFGLSAKTIPGIYVRVNKTLNSEKRSNHARTR